MKILVYLIFILLLFSSCTSKSGNVQTEEREENKELVLYDPAKGIYYDTSGVDPEMQKILDDFEKRNKRDSNSEVRPYISPKKLKPLLGTWKLKDNTDQFGYDQIEVTRSEIVLYENDKMIGRMKIKMIDQDDNFLNRLSLITAKEYYCFYFGSKKVYFNNCCEDCIETQLLPSSSDKH